MTTIQPLTIKPVNPETASASPSPAKGKAAPVQKVPAVTQGQTQKAQEGQKPEVTVDTQRMTEELNRIIEKLGVELSFSVDHDLDVVVAKITKAGSDEVIRQIPSEEMLDLARRLKEMEARGDSKGALLDSLQG